MPLSVGMHTYYVVQRHDYLSVITLLMTEVSKTETVGTVVPTGMSQAETTDGMVVARRTDEVTTETTDMTAVDTGKYYV